MVKTASKLFLLAALFSFAPGSTQAIELPVNDNKPLKAIENALKDPTERAADLKKTVPEVLKKEGKEVQDAVRENLKTQKEDSRESQEKQKATVSGNICENIGSRLESLVEKKSEFHSKHQDNHLEKLVNRRAEQDAKLAEKRAEADKRRALMYDKLGEKADSDEERAAVTAFKERIESEVVERRVAVDAAITTYRTGVDKLWQDKQASLATDQEEFITKAEAALAEAKKDCEAGVSAGSVHSEFQATLNTARKELAADRLSANEVAEALKALKETKKTAVEQAREEFRADLTEAKDTLRAVFGEEAI